MQPLPSKYCTSANWESKNINIETHHAFSNEKYGSFSNFLLNTTLLELINKKEILRLKKKDEKFVLSFD